MPLWNARAWQAEGLEQGTAALLEASASHLLPPVPPMAASALPAAKNTLWLSCDCSSVPAPARGASRHSPVSHVATLTQHHWLRGWPQPCNVCLVQLPEIAGTLSSGLVSVGADPHGMAGTCPRSALLPVSSDSPLIGTGEGSEVWEGCQHGTWGQAVTTRHTLCWDTATPVSAAPAVTRATLLLSRCLLKMVKGNIIVPEDILSFCCNGLQVPFVPCN